MCDVSLWICQVSTAAMAPVEISKSAAWADLKVSVGPNGSTHSAVRHPWRNPQQQGGIGRTVMLLEPHAQREGKKAPHACRKIEGPVDREECEASRGKNKANKAGCGELAIGLPLGCRRTRQRLTPHI